MQELPTADEVAAASRELGLAASAAELHGALCGWLCGDGGDLADWPARVLADPSLPAPPPGSALDRLRQGSAARLDDGEFAFQLVLDDDDAPLHQRAQALFDWCRGFLGGFGLAAGASPPLSEEGAEALQDLGKLAGARVQDIDEDEEDESALSELEEFVRVATLLLHGDCVLGPRHRRRLN
ncbi:YecA family protein [Pseudoxanthomonas broegbernensis]|uniref:YecA family protein n=1 Tax=Pseudoxanthomonas broegbernensis TaxID=83619 RepID=A0A7V8GP14_9GAMM|nr:UPF0149 family protein [Pseudoxanthomonas broegbernensis]KAF1687321.1 YecA family protein [Pseudoxanthomonas broegbernensis]MBB6065681.1 hypothetical protein [Pseudoxanthomonas broegbernensis]